MPTIVKNSVTDLLLHIGGVHSGCGMSSVLWLGLAIARLLQNPQLTTAAQISIACIILILLLLACLTAFPFTALAPS